MAELFAASPSAAKKPGTVTVSQVSAGRFQGQGARSLRALLVEGYLEPADRSPGYRVSGLGHSFDRATRLWRRSPTSAMLTPSSEGTSPGRRPSRSRRE